MQTTPRTQPSPSNFTGRREDPLPDLLKAGIPFRPALWLIVIEPLKPRTTSDGGIEVVTASENAEDYLTTVGRVISCGPAAFKGKTTSGIELREFLDGITTPEELVGKFVFYQQHVGATLTLRKTEQKVKVMALTDILGVTDDPQAWKFYI